MYSIKETNVKARSQTDSKKMNIDLKWLAKIGFWNIRTMREPGKLKQVAKDMEGYKPNILGLSDISWKEFGTLTLQNGLTLLYCSVPTDVHIEVELAFC
jgi:hypothetical protein